MKMSLIYLKMNLSRQNTFSYEWFHTKTCFDTMAQGNSGMAYGENSFSALLRRLTDRVSDDVIILRYFIYIHGLKKRPCHLVALPETNTHIVNEAYMYATAMKTAD